MLYIGRVVYPLSYATINALHIFSFAMLNSKILLTTFTAVMLISVLLSVGLPSNNRSSENNNVEVIPIDLGAEGPESFDFDPVDGSGPYTGVSDGRIIKWISNERRWTDFAVTSFNR